MIAVSLVACRVDFAGAADHNESQKPIKIRVDFEKSVDAPDVGYQRARTFLTDEEWNEQVSALRDRFTDWEKDNDGADIGRYLNDRFIIVALSAVSGDVEKIKRGIVWLAFYKEFNQQAPSVVSTALKKHRTSLAHLFQDFTWERASLYIKNKEWRKDHKRFSENAETAEKKGS